MSTDIFYFKFRFGNAEKFSFQLEELKKFINEGYKAYEFWQDNRDKFKDLPRRFWEKFEIQFPQIKEFLESIGKFGGDCNNTLAGILEFPTPEASEKINDQKLVFSIVDELWGHGSPALWAKYIAEKLNIKSEVLTEDELAERFMED